MVLGVIVGGLAGGLVAIVVLSALMLFLLEDEPLPTQLFASKFVNDRTPEQNRSLGLGILGGYGLLMGLLLMILAAIGGFETSVLGTAAFGLLWGLILWFLALFWMGVLGILSDLRDAPQDEVRKRIFGSLGGNLLFGVVAGVVGALLAGLL